MGSVFRLQSESERITFMPLTDIVKIDDGNNPPLYMKIPRYNAAKLIRNALGFNDVQRRTKEKKILYCHRRIK